MVKTIALDVKGGCEAYTAPKGNTVGAKHLEVQAMKFVILASIFAKQRKLDTQTCLPRLIKAIRSEKSRRLSLGA